MKQREKLFNLRVTDYHQEIMAVLLVLIALGNQMQTASSLVSFFLFFPLLNVAH